VLSTNYIKLYEGTKNMLNAIKEKGGKIYLLSNASYRQHVYWQNVPVAEVFDGTMISADVHLVKPQPEIYELMCRRFSLKKEECVFIDDSTPNAEGAFFVGMPAIVFHDDAKELRRKLRELGVRCEA
ncbi:MAG: HAD-IA family hydrolase, partial [Oscillospiraceae bacterium]|nr:HAD-IA family hydrolase [Oscillospiraceae bacterium]